MSKRMNKFKSELKLLATCQPVTARILFKQAPKEFIRAIVDATWTTLTGKLNLFSFQQLRFLTKVVYFVSLMFGFMLCLRRDLFTSASCNVLKISNNRTFVRMS